MTKNDAEMEFSPPMIAMIARTMIIRLAVPVELAVLPESSEKGRGPPLLAPSDPL
jgi:hypothetical protein